MRAASAVHLWERWPDVSWNLDLVDEGLKILRPILVEYEIRELTDYYGKESWWEQGVSPYLEDYERFTFKDCATDEEKASHFDSALALRVIDRNWYTVFRSRFHSYDGLNWIKGGQECAQQLGAPN